MLRISPSMHKTYRDRLHLFFFDQPLDGFHHVGPVERDDLVALIIHALAYADNALPRDERFRLRDPSYVLDLIVRKSVHPSDSTHDLGGIFESFCRDEAGFDAAARDERVGCDRAAVFKEGGFSEEF